MYQIKKRVNTMTTGEKIKSLRKEKGLTQTELGKLIGVQQSAIRKYEHGDVVNIPYKTIQKMAEIFSVTPEYLLGWYSATNNDLQEWDEKCNTDDIRNQSYILKTMQRIMPDVYELLMEYNDLNEDGKKEAILRVRELGFLPQYKKDENE